ncbi:hypothetical protein HID58_020413 [Brassica napus]|uniref:CAP-Gly domain-containing protein n=1 Tax=Brassica napus TaxID=3708 RepID=A0ABQ7XGX5_BRANA|nr:hypothetical protein HID58_020413 [Brassica napus]
MATSRLQMEGDDSVLLHVTHSNLKSFAADVRFSPQVNECGSCEEKLWKKCGTSVNAMALELYDESGSKVAVLVMIRDHSVLLPFDGFRLHIVDLDPSSVTTGGWLEDTSLVEKYTISEEDYAKRTDSYRKFKEKRVAQNPAASEVKTKEEDFMEDLCGNIKVGNRCQVEPGEKRGVVKYVGRAESLGPGYWVGIQYDEPLGKHDGMVKGTRLFECPQLHGGVVRPDKVKVGDYPERDPFEEDEI